MTITGGTALSKDEIDRMVKEAESAAAEDHRRRETAEARNQADQVVYQVDKFVADNGDKIPEADKTELARVTDELKEVLKDQEPDAERLRAGSDAVMAVFGRIGQSMYQNVQTPEGGAPSAGDGDAGSLSDEDEVVEGEIVEEGGAS